MKMLFFVVFLTAMQAVPPIPRKTADTPATGSQTIKNKSGDKQAPTTPSPISNTTTAEKERNGGNRPPATNEPESVLIRELPPVKIATDWWSKFYVVFTGLLVVIGFVGVYGAYKTLTKIGEQTTATRKAAEATEKSVRLQEIAMRQWITIEKWHGQIIARQGEKILEFTFDIANRTKFPLTLEYITTNAHGCAMQRKADQVLAPESVSNVKGVTGKLSEDQILKYEGTRLTMLVEGAVVYEDVFEKRRTQRFNAMCSGSAHSEFVFYPYAGAKESDQKT